MEEPQPMVQVPDEHMEDGEDSGNEQEMNDQGQTQAEAQHQEPGMPLNRVDATDPRVQAVYKKLEDAGAKVFYEKVMTASDTAGSGRVVVPKAIAEQYFPRLDQATGMPFSCLDIDGRMYTFKWRFWINNQSRMYLLEGAAELHHNYGMAVGDVMVFAQKQSDQSLLLAGRPPMQGDTAKKPPQKKPKDGSAPRKERGPRPPRVPGSAPGGRGEKRRRTDTPGGGMRGRPMAAGRLFVPGMEYEGAVDGIFRAAVGYPMYPPGVVQSKTGRWVATIDCAGESYHAFFESQEDATEVLRATGVPMGMPTPLPLPAPVQMSPSIPMTI